MGEHFKIIVKWGTSEYEITELTKDDSVCDLKKSIQTRTRVLPKRQKLLNLKLKGKPSTDDAKLSEFNFKPGFKLLMMGSLEEDIEQTSAPPSDMPVVVNDFDIEEEVHVPIEEKEEYLKKVQKRISEYKPTVLNEPRSNKSLLVLDIDYTLFDHRSAAEQGIELMRPYLHQFLTSAYEDYDIIIWSATSMKWICEKMKLLGVSSHSDYKIMAYFDSAAMITVHAPKYGVIEVKPLGVIWGLYTQFGTWNTIMFDDLRRNFLMNPKNGLKVKPFRDAHINRYHDDELLKLSKYLKHISKLGNFAELNHRSWEKYLEKKERLAKERH